MIHPVILAGGSGTRLWPLSRESYPKQFLQLTGDRSLLQEAVRRLDGIDDVADPVIVCNEAHRFLVMEKLRQVGRMPLAVVLEAVGRNTAPASTLAALTLVDRSAAPESDPLMLVMPADHVIRDLDAFHATILGQVPTAEAGHIVAFGVVPSAPDTGLGYIRKGEVLQRELAGMSVAAVSAQGGRPARETESAPTLLGVVGFVQKPDLATAQAYVETGEYLWNTSIFMMRASVWLSELRRHREDIAKACEAAHANTTVDGDFSRPGVDEFAACPSESIDIAVMGRAEEEALRRGRNGNEPLGCVVAPLEAGWSDVGRWSALWEETDQDSDGNVIQGDVVAGSTKNSLVLAQNRLVATVGLEDAVVIETADAVLVARKDRVHQVKELVEKLKGDRRPEQENHRKVHRPWGSYEVVDGGTGFQVKRITIRPGAAISLQKHYYRAEHWVVVRGTARVTKGDEVFLLEENQSTYVSEGMVHRLENAGTGPLEIVEVQSGMYLSEDDVVRFDDDHNRHNVGRPAQIGNRAV